MEKYIKPKCEINEIEFENNLMAGSTEPEVKGETGETDNNGDVIWHAPKSPDMWNND